MHELLVIIPCWLVVMTIELAMARFIIGVVNETEKRENRDNNTRK